MLTIRAWGNAGAGAVPAAAWEAQRLEGLWSRFQPASEVSKLKEQAGRWVSVTPETCEVLLAGLELHDLTQGAFDVTVGGGAHGALEHSRGRFRIAPGTRLDLGGIGKGSAVGRLIHLLVTRGVEAAIVSFGESSIGVHGNPPGGRPWRVGIRSPSGGRAATLQLGSGFLSTSGDYEQTSARGNHVIDPRTGRAAGSGVRSATVLAADPARAEALSTAMMVLGVGPGLELQARVGGFEAVLIDEQGDLTSTM
jgi:thiamine biosynthesis lipoprotein